MIRGRPCLWLWLAGLLVCGAGAASLAAERKVSGNCLAFLFENAKDERVNGIYWKIGNNAGNADSPHATYAKPWTKTVCASQPCTGDKSSSGAQGVSSMLVIRRCEGCGAWTLRDFQFSQCPDRTFVHADIYRLEPLDCNEGDSLDRYEDALWELAGGAADILPGVAGAHGRPATVTCIQHGLDLPMERLMAAKLARNGEKATFAPINLEKIVKERVSRKIAAFETREKLHFDEMARAIEADHERVVDLVAHDIRHKEAQATRTILDELRSDLQKQLAVLKSGVAALGGQEEDIKEKLLAISQGLNANMELKVGKEALETLAKKSQNAAVAQAKIFDALARQAGEKVKKNKEVLGQAAGVLVGKDSSALRRAVDQQAAVFEDHEASALSKMRADIMEQQQRMKHELDRLSAKVAARLKDRWAASAPIFAPAAGAPKLDEGTPKPVTPKVWEGREQQGAAASQLARVGLTLTADGSAGTLDPSKEPLAAPAKARTVAEEDAAIAAAKAQKATKLGKQAAVKSARADLEAASKEEKDQVALRATKRKKDRSDAAAKQSQADSAKAAGTAVTKATD